MIWSMIWTDPNPARITNKNFSEFYAKEQARTKKLANSLVAWSIMKQLYQVSPNRPCTKPWPWRKIRVPNFIGSNITVKFVFSL